MPFRYIFNVYTSAKCHGIFEGWVVSILMDSPARVLSLGEYQVPHKLENCRGVLFN